MNVELNASNHFGTNGRMIDRYFVIDPVGHPAAVSMLPGNFYIAPVGAAVSVFMRNLSGEAATMTVQGGCRTDGRELADISLLLPADDGLAVRGALLDPAYGSLFGNPPGKVALYVDHGPILCVVCVLNPGVSL